MPLNENGSAGIQVAQAMFAPLVATDPGTGKLVNVMADSVTPDKTLPLGTTARVTNLQTGKSADVTIKDRGPVPRGRVVDLTPHSASQIGLTKKEGVAPVAVVPTSLPPGTTETATARP